MRGELVLRAESGADPPPKRKAAPDWGSARGDQTSVEEGKTSEDQNYLPSPNLQAPVRRKEPPPLPGRGSYRVIVVDTPWPYEIQKDDPSATATHPFPQMSIEQICAVKVNDIAHEDCLLWLRTTNHHMREAFTVLDAWGFVQKTILTWSKDRMGTGDRLRGQTEDCLLAVRGKPTAEPNQTTLLHGPMRKNSQKPLEFYDFVEVPSPAPRFADLFSRYRHNEKWDCHGDGAPPEAGR
jgi:N6-adenosine-specific RNA methylase IME4